MNWLSEFVDRFVLDPDDRAIALGLLTRTASSGPDAATAFLEACRLIGEAATEGAELRDAVDLRRSGPVLERICLLVIACFAVVRADYAARPDAQAAREWISGLGDETVDPAGEAFGSDVMEWLSRVVGEAVTQVSAVAATRAPLVRVETRVSLPSSLLAFDLYGQPARGAELTARARSGTPLVMPAAFEALAP